MAVTKQVNLVISVKDKASAALNTINKKFSVSLKDIGIAMGGIGVAVGGAAVAFDKLAGRAGTLEQLRLDFDKLSESIGSTSEQALQKLQEATLGTVSAFDLMAVGNKIMLQGIAQSDDEMANIVETALRLGDQTLSTTQRIEGFTALLRNKTIMRLDEFGISSGIVTDRIKELQEETPGLSRDTAFLTATLEEAKKNMDLLGEAEVTTSVQTQQLKADFADLKDNVITELTPSFRIILDEMTPVMEETASVIATNLENSEGFWDEFFEDVKKKGGTDQPWYQSITHAWFSIIEFEEEELARGMQVWTNFVNFISGNKVPGDVGFDTEGIRGVGGGGGSFAQGGIVPGSSFSGDRLTARVNSGEMVLNSDQQKNLFSMINNGSGGGGGVVNFNVSIPMMAGDEGSIRQISERMWQELERIAASKNVNIADLKL